VVYQYRDIVTLPLCFTHSLILLFFAASCGEMPSFDYTYRGPPSYRGEVAAHGGYQLLDNLFFLVRVTLNAGIDQSLCVHKN